MLHGSWLMAQGSCPGPARGASGEGRGGPGPSAMSLGLLGFLAFDPPTIEFLGFLIFEPLGRLRFLTPGIRLEPHRHIEPLEPVKTPLDFLTLGAMQHRVQITHQVSKAANTNQSSTKQI